MYDIIIGIDPGLQGAVAIMDTDLHTVEFFDTPIIKNGKKTEYDIQLMATLFKPYQNCDTLIAIEKSQAMPKQGVVSTFSIGYGYGLWMGIITTLHFPVEIIRPVTWKRHILADMPKEKYSSIIKAKALFPDASSSLTRKKDHGRADALLIAEYARRISMI